MKKNISSFRTSSNFGWTINLLYANDLGKMVLNHTVMMFSIESTNGWYRAPNLLPFFL